MKFLQNLLVHIPVGHNASTNTTVSGSITRTRFMIRLASASAAFSTSTVQRVTFLTKCKHLTHNHPFPFSAGICRPVSYWLRSRRAVIKTYAGSNRLHTVHPSTTAFNAYVHTYTHVSHFAGIEMAATDLSPIYHRTHGNACTYIYVYKSFGNLSESPDAFGSCSALHIIVYMARACHIYPTVPLPAQSAVSCSGQSAARHLR